MSERVYRDLAEIKASRSFERYGDSGKIMDANPEAAIEAYTKRDAKEVTGSGAYEPFDRPGRGVIADRAKDHLQKYGADDGIKGRAGREGRVSPTGGPMYPADGPAWLEGINNGTQVQHAAGKNDQADVGRPRAITY